MVFTETDAVYTHPIDSRQIVIYKVRLSDGRLKHLPPETSVTKALCYAEFSADYLVFIELLHSV